MKEIRLILDTELQLYPLCSILRIIQENLNSNSETVKRYFFYVQVKLKTVAFTTVYIKPTERETVKNLCCIKIITVQLDLKTRFKNKKMFFLT